MIQTTVKISGMACSMCEAHKQFFDENGAAYPVWQALEAEAGRYLR